MREDVLLFTLRGVLLLIVLELIFLPFRGLIVEMIERVLPPGYSAVWACTGLDEVFLYVSFVLAYPSGKKKLPYLVLGTLAIELYNALRIYITLLHPDPFLHEVLFRWGGFLLVLLLFFIVFRRLSDRQ